MHERVEPGYALGRDAIPNFYGGMRLNRRKPIKVNRKANPRKKLIMQALR
jgi:hypothetical protein